MGNDRSKFKAFLSRNTEIMFLLRGGKKDILGWLEKQGSSMHFGLKIALSEHKKRNWD